MTQKTRYHLAQINIAQAKQAMESPIMSGFVKRLDEINLLAEKSPGFVWRLQTEEGDATGIKAYDDQQMVINLTVWQDIDSLKHYVYQSAHIELIQDRKRWFSKMESMQLALWWVPIGHIPSIEEGKNKLDLLQSDGVSERVFTFAKPYPCPA